MPPPFQKLTTMGEKIQAIREELKGMSLAVAELVKFGQYPNVNAAIIGEFHRKGEHQVFHTYRQWQEQGYQVKKGSKSFHIWSRPIDAIKAQENPDTPATDEAERKYFAVAFLFSNAQVEPIQQHEQQKAA